MIFLCQLELANASFASATQFTETELYLTAIMNCIVVYFFIFLKLCHESDGSVYYVRCYFEED